MYCFMFISLAVCIAFCFANTEKVRYDNYHVYKVIPSTKEQVQLLSDLDAATDSLFFLNSINFVGKHVDVVVAPHKVPDFVQALQQNSIKHLLIEKDAQSKLETGNSITPRVRNSSYSWKAYHTLDETYDWLESLHVKYPEQIEIVVGGKTYEGREIKGVKLSKKSGNKGVFIEGGIHAREWIAPATVTYILNELLTSTNEDIKYLANNFDWYFFPHANPDGYVFTHKTNRLWRKTRTPYGLCYGADPNRNWGFHWNEIGSTNLPCSDAYAGKSAFSEIETDTFSKYIASLKGKIQTYISFHSFSQLLLFPYGHTKKHAANHKDLQQIGDATVKALAKRYGTKYTVGNIYGTIYPASGASVDWAFGELGIPLAYCYELRPFGGGWNGFILPEKEIIPTGEETLDSLVALLKEAQKLKYY